MGLASRLRLAKLHLITDTRREQGDFRDLVVEALRGGVDVVQVRDPQADDEQMLEALEVARSAALQVNATVVACCRPELASRFGADAVHLGAAAGSEQEARHAVGQYGLLGRSVHDEQQLAAARADYLFVGPVLDAAGGSEGLPGLDLVRAAAAAHPVDDVAATPWFAVGGITGQSLEEVLRAGALRIAVSSAITRADDPRAAAASLRQRLQQAWDEHPGMEAYAMAALGGGTARLLGTPVQER